MLGKAARSIGLHPANACSIYATSQGVRRAPNPLHLQLLHAGTPAMSGLLIIGASYAGVQAAISAREAGYQAPIRIVADEADLPYQRPPLSKGFLSGSVAHSNLILRGADFCRPAHRYDARPPRHTDRSRRPLRRAARRRAPHL
ncbi:FAD-dependent oxidoreductase [Rhodopseudomonas sp. P2A-2r]|uniref:FAD-dependent oxidoreductase n=1 Tax=Rhodopseudomonas sp. P2A-2r TaxID=2991972 RepID=UPI0039B6EBCF